VRHTEGGQRRINLPLLSELESAQRMDGVLGCGLAGSCGGGGVLIGAVIGCPVCGSIAGCCAGGDICPP
jgi:hypothetical protein